MWSRSTRSRRQLASAESSGQTPRQHRCRRASCGRDAQGTDMREGASRTKRPPRLCTCDHIRLDDEMGGTPARAVPLRRPAPYVPSSPGMVRRRCRRGRGVDPPGGRVRGIPLFARPTETSMRLPSMRIGGGEWVFMGVRAAVARVPETAVLARAAAEVEVVADRGDVVVRPALVGSCVSGGGLALPADLDALLVVLLLLVQEGGRQLAVDHLAHVCHCLGNRRSCLGVFFGASSPPRPLLC